MLYMFDTGVLGKIFPIHLILFGCVLYYYNPVLAQRILGQLTMLYFIQMEVTEKGLFIFFFSLTKVTVSSRLQKQFIYQISSVCVFHTATPKNTVQSTREHTAFAETII